MGFHGSSVDIAGISIGFKRIEMGFEWMLNDIDGSSIPILVDIDGYWRFEQMPTLLGY
jgi:hypothetical protein